jgi:hypothetical protein
MSENKHYSVILDKAHEDEQTQGRVFNRKEFHAYLPNDMAALDKRSVIKLWQQMKWQRSMNVLKVSQRRQIMELHKLKG